MKLYLIIFTIFIFNVNSMEESLNSVKRLTYKEIYDPDNTYYVLNTEKEYKTIENLEKNELITNSSTYTYEWSDHITKEYVNLKDSLPKGDTEGYIDMSKYELIILNVYSKNNVGSEIVLVIECQRKETENKVNYKYYKIQIDFIGWKEIVIPYKYLDDGGGDLSKVSSLIINSRGWGCTPNKDTVLYIDKLLFTKMKIVFNMEESEISEENYSNILKKFKYSLIGSGSLVNEKNSNIIKRLKEIVKSAKKIHDEINTLGLPFSSSMTDTQDMNDIYYKIRQMAMGYAVKGGEINNDEQFLKDIIYSLDYMHDNYYTKKDKNIFPGFDNWWNWYIGIPQALIETIVYIKDELTEEQINKYLSPVNQYIPLPSMTMANRADIAYSCIISGVLQKNYTRIAFSVEMLRELFNKVEIGDGFYNDGSFIQHFIYAYIGGYGSSLIDSLSKISYSLDETCFMLDDEMKENQFEWIFNSFLPFMFEGAFYDLVRGRGVDRNIEGLSTGINVINSFFFVTKYLKDEKNIQLLKTYLKYIYEKEQIFYNNSLGIGSLGILEEIILDKSIKTNNIEYNFAKIYSRMDKAIAQINGVGLGISLSSPRTGKYESINGENQKGWYQGDGMTYIYLSPQDYASLYWPYVNYYRLPGTTITTSPREEKELGYNNVFSKYDFVGGVYFDVNMVAVMQLESENPLVDFYSSLIGNKAYFVLGNIFVFIGNNINCDDDYNVETIIENRKLKGKLYFGDKEITEKSGNVTDNYIYIENYGGIFIPDYSNVKFEITDNDFLEIYFEHGKKIKNGFYKYFLLPKIEKNDLEKYIDKIEIISETNKITAVKNKENNIMEYVFWEKGKLDNIEVDNPCTIILSENELYIADPTQRLDFINVNVGENNYMVELSKGYTSKIKLKN